MAFELIALSGASGGSSDASFPPMKRISTHLTREPLAPSDSPFNPTRGDRADTDFDMITGRTFFLDAGNDVLSFRT